MIGMSSKAMKNRVYEYITKYTDANSFMPSFREIGAAVGLKSSSSVSHYIELLKGEGKLMTVYPKARTFSLAQKIDLDITVEHSQRIRIEVADGGVLFLDCYINKVESQSVSVSFSGIVDTSQIKGKVSQVVNCWIEDGIR